MIDLRAIFFDFDGVILESADIKTEAFLELFADQPQHLSAIKSYHLEHMGISRFVKFEWIYKELLHQELSTAEKEQLGIRFSSIVFNKILQAPFVPGAREILKACKGRIKKFVASGTPEEELRAIITQRNLSSDFDEVCGVPRSKVQIVNELLAKYALAPRQCLFVGDAGTDYQAAKATGLYFVARNTPTLEEFWMEQGVHRVEHLMEISEHFLITENQVK